MHPILAIVLLAALAAAPALGEVAVIDRGGKLQALSAAGRYLDISTDLKVAARGWGSLPGWGEAQNVRYTQERGVRSWSGVVRPGPGQEARLEQTLQERDGAAVMDFTVTALTDLDTEGVHVWLDVPIAVYQGGGAGLTRNGARVASATLPRQRPAVRHLVNGEADGLRLSAPGGTAIEVMADRAVPVTVQDTREWQGAAFSAFLQVAGSLRKGERARLRLTLRPEPTRTPDAAATVRLNAGKALYRLQGIGGNYCFNIESPITQHTLANLDVGWARTEMSLDLWEPRNDNAAAGDTDWTALEAADQPDSRIRRELELARQIQRKGIPYVSSVWRLPTWLYRDGRSDNGQVVPRDRWPEMAECVSSYLLYAKRKYGVEPLCFSFNESDWGVQVRLTAEEHRDVIKLLGARFAELGLKTRLLLGDVTNPRGTEEYTRPTERDPEAMRYVGAVAFHSWGGAQPRQYADWSALSRRIGVPLLVAELGVDAQAWRTAAFDTYHYALREMQHYQEVLTHARPQGTMQWEFTGDYGVMDVAWNDGRATLTPTPRYWVVKHFCNLTPRNADALEVTSDRADVLVTAFRGPAKGRARTYTVHLVNLGGRREATLTGIPAGVRSLRVVRTNQVDGFKEGAAVRAQNGKVTVTLEGSGMVTLVGESR